MIEYTRHYLYGHIITQYPIRIKGGSTHCNIETSSGILSKGKISNSGVFKSSIIIYQASEPIAVFKYPVLLSNRA